VEKIACRLKRLLIIFGLCSCLCTAYFSHATTKPAPAVPHSDITDLVSEPPRAESDDPDRVPGVFIPGAPLFWEVRLRMTVGESDKPKNVRLFLPISEARQTVLKRAFSHEPLQFEEHLTDDNLVGHWSTDVERDHKQIITCDFTVRVDGEAQPLPLTRADVANRLQFLKPEPNIASQDPEIRRQVAQLAAQSATSDERMRAIYDFVHTAIFWQASPGPLDAMQVLQSRKGDAAGKSRLTVALLRAAGVPSRMVGGLIMRDLKKRKYTYWVEAQSGDHWIELDPTEGFFGRVPNRYLALFRGDTALIHHSANIDFEYEFLVMQTTHEAAGQMSDLFGDSEPGHSVIHAGNEKAMSSAVASIVWISDDVMPESLVEKITAVASAEQVKISFLTAPAEAKLFRGELIEEVMAHHDRLIRQADALVIQTRDDAGLYAMMSQGDRGTIFKKKIIYLNGDMYRSVANFFGHALQTMLAPRGLYMLPDRLDANALWDLVDENFLGGVPIEEVTAKWHRPLMQFHQGVASDLSWWRTFLMHTWVRAAQEGVQPHNINLVLVLPIFALCIVIYRGVIGIETFGTFSPAILCVAFLRTGLFWGVFLFCIILGLGTLLRLALSRVHLFLVARVALLLSLVALVMLFAAMVGIWWGVGPLVNVSVFPMVIMAGIIENFTRTQMEIGFAEAVKLSLSTLAICATAYLLTEWLALQSLIFVFPEGLLLIMALTIAIGLWRGLRLVELWKYYRLGKHA